MHSTYSRVTSRPRTPTHEPHTPSGPEPRSPVHAPCPTSPPPMRAPSKSPGSPRLFTRELGVPGGSDGHDEAPASTTSYYARAWAAQLHDPTQCRLGRLSRGCSVGSARSCPVSPSMQTRYTEAQALHMAVLVKLPGSFRPSLLERGLETTLPRT